MPHTRGYGNIASFFYIVILIRENIRGGTVSLSHTLTHKKRNHTMYTIAFNLVRLACRHKVSKYAAIAHLLRMRDMYPDEIGWHWSLWACREIAEA